MKSYSSGYSPLRDITIWQAARATSAASTFFKQLVIGNRKFVDGGLGSNNPSKALLREVQEIYKNNVNQKASCLISIGTGIPKGIGISELSGFGISWVREVVEALSGMATDCENTNEEVAAWFKDIPGFYFRFNVEQGLQNVKMDEYEKLDVIVAKTEGYLSKDAQRHKIKQAAEALQSKNTGLYSVLELSN